MIAVIVAILIGLGAAVAPPLPAAPPPRPVFAALKEADLTDVAVFIDAASQVGAMPAPTVTLAALVQARSPTAKLVKDGAVVLTGARTREGVWAYEARAVSRGGLVVTRSGVVTMTAAELAKALKATTR